MSKKLTIVILSFYMALNLLYVYVKVRYNISILELIEATKPIIITVLSAYFIKSGYENGRKYPRAR